MNEHRVDVDLDAYFARIAYQGPREPTLATLSALHFAHPRAIPFENLDVLLGRPIELGLGPLQEQLIARRRGGYCFQHNTVFAAVLRALGFRVTTLSGRTRLNVPAGQTSPRTHMILVVEIDGTRYLADTGYGGLSLTAPLLLDTEEPQATPHERHRIVQEGWRRVLQAELGTLWTDVYEFTLEEQRPIDYELANWYTSTHPDSRFRQNLMVARTGGPGERFYISNAELVVRRGGVAERRTFETPEELLATLKQVFGLSFPPGTRFGALGSPWPR